MEHGVTRQSLKMANPLALFLRYNSTLKLTATKSGSLKKALYAHFLIPTNTNST
ncbi:hypothetical protein P20652_3374 [Pseudoalteromonas sp. BSi20652]|nr:hypothetical protein P20652_3374 [Pseudoalteromonas sp. BSi20652]